MGQASGSNARLSWKKELTSGVPNFASGTADTTLASAISPGATSIVVASATGIAAEDKLRVGDDYNPEYVEVDSTYVSGTTIPLHANTPINFRHEAGEIVKEVVPGGFRKIAGFVTVDTLGEIAKIVSNAITSQRGTPASRGGNVSVDFNMTAELGIEQSGIFLRYALGKNYATVGTAVGGGGSTTTNALIAAGDTTLPLTTLTGFAAGEYVQVDTGDDAEIVKISASWNGTDNPVLLDASYPFRKAHSSGVAAVEVASPFTTTIKRGSQLDSLTFLLHLTDINSLALVKGAKINSVSSSFAPNDETIKLTMAINAMSMQILQRDIFGTPAGVSHTFYAPWEIKIKRDASVINIVEAFNFTLTNGIDGGRGRVIGSRFKASITPGRGDCTGSFDYQLADATLLKKMVFDQAVALEAVLTYIGDTNHQLNLLFPVAKLTGGMHPGVPNDGPISDSKNFDSEYDDVTELTDLKVTIKSSEAIFE
jgi:hypothetical protein